MPIATHPSVITISATLPIPALSREIATPLRTSNREPAHIMAITTIATADHPMPLNQPAFNAMATATGVPNAKAVTPKPRFSNKRAFEMEAADRLRFL
ncbi:hypothetical protein MyNCGM70_01140 [Achromobacter xylosoxidans]